MHESGGTGAHLGAGLIGDHAGGADDVGTADLAKTRHGQGGGQHIPRLNSPRVAEPLLAVHDPEQVHLFGVEEVRNPNLLRVRMTNRGSGTLENPTVEVWLPPRVSSAELGGDYLMKHNVTVSRVPDEPAYLISVPDLAPHEDRLIKLKLSRP